MKNLFNSSTLFMLVLSLAIFSSCEKDQDNTSIEPTIDFEMLQLELSNNERYIDYMEANKELFTNIIEGKVNLIEIHSTLKYHDIDDYCNFDNTLFSDVKSSDLFFESYCTMRSNLEILRGDYQELNLLSEDQAKTLFEVQLSSIPNYSNTAEERISCIYVFQASIVLAEMDLGCGYEDSPSNCSDLVLDIAIGAYDLCCQSSIGTGCAP